MTLKSSPYLKRSVGSSRAVVRGDDGLPREATKEELREIDATFAPYLKNSMRQAGPAKSKNK